MKKLSLAYSRVILVNNTNADIRCFESAIIRSIRNRQPLPAEIRDLFSLEIVKVNGKRRGILRKAETK